jgi:chromosome partitioning protein
MILAIVNQKGGVAKTTSAIALALHIARMGHNLLVIDADPQADTTFGFNIGEDAIKTSLADVLSRSRTPVESVVMPDVFPGVDLIPSHIELSRSELQLASEIAGENMLSRALAPIKDRYDYVLIDCPPSLGMLTVNALVACEGVLVPTAAAPFAFKGMEMLFDTVQLVKEHLNPNCRAHLKATYAEMFETTIPTDVRLAEIGYYGDPTIALGDSRGAIAYGELAKEVVSRCHVHENEAN